MGTAHTKAVAMLLATIALMFGASAQAQGVPLRAGSYRCFTIGPGAIGPDSSPRDPAWRRAHGMPELEHGQRATPPMQVPEIMITPAFFGNIALDGKGGYRLTGTGHTGRYGFDRAAGVPTFTGDLAIMKVAQYDGGKGHFFLIYETLAFECGLEGYQAVRPAAQPAPRSIRKGGMADFTGHYEGSYVCNNAARGMQLDIKATPDGTLVAVYRSKEGDNEAYSLVGRWTPDGFVLEPNEWINHSSPRYEMVGMAGVLTKDGLAGQFKHPRCTTFALVRR